ncbi:MFS transporter [Actinoplanes sp. NPDC049596]|uniref:MFS transporter n=1 Tax=unclassified Actinoplanes TaxID=2626549 RepID=UPI003422F6D6
MSVEVKARAGWSAVAPVAAASFTLVLSEFIAVAVLPSIASGLGVTDGDAGLAVVLPGLVAAIAAPGAVLVAGRLDRRTLLCGLTVLLALSNILAGLAPTFPVLLIARALLGVAVGAFWTIGVAVGPRLVRPERVATATALITAGISAATVVSLPVGSVLAQHWGWRWALLLAGGLAVVVTGWQALTLPAMPATESAPGWSALTSVLRSRRDQAGIAVAALLFFAHFGAYTFITPYLTGTAHFSPTAVSALLLGFGAAGLIGNFAAGAAVGRALAATLGALALILAGSISLLIAVADVPLGVAALVLLWGLSWGGIPLVVQTYMMGGRAAEGGLALFVSTTQLSLAAGSAVGGQIVDRWGLGPDYVTFAVPALIAMVLTATAIRHYSQAGQA